MFENRFNKFLKSTSERVVSSDTQMIIPMSSNEKGNVNYDETNGPSFDENFDLINVASSSVGASKSPPVSQKELKKPIIIKTVQV